jgi:cytosine deaminase
MRAFADTDTRAGLRAVKALLSLRDEFKGRLTLQVVAFPQQGLLRDPGAAKLVREAVELGADIVGGIPWLEETPAAAESHIEAVFEIATSFDREVSMLVDDAGDPELRTLEMLAGKTIEAGWQGRVLAHHARATALYGDLELDRLLTRLREARVGIVTDPHTGPLHVPVRRMIEAGIPLALGQDDISDAYYPYGRNNMLEVAFLASHLLWMTTDEDRRQLFRMVTVDAARVLGLSQHRLEAGMPANLVVLGAPDLLEAFREHRAPAFVISDGEVVSLG